MQADLALFQVRAHVPGPFRARADKYVPYGLSLIARTLAPGEPRNRSTGRNPTTSLTRAAGVEHEAQEDKVAMTMATGAIDAPENALDLGKLQVLNLSRWSA